MPKSRGGRWILPPATCRQAYVRDGQRRGHYDLRLRHRQRPHGYVHRPTLEHQHFYLQLRGPRDHNDPAGQEAAQRWSSRLSVVAHRIEVFQFTGLVRADGQPVKDLNDLCPVDPECADPRLKAVTKF